MKHDCDIVRDLMPMCIDGTASDKAKTMVEEHVQECPLCDKIYAEMKGETKIELPVQSASTEFVTTVKKMQKQRKRRTWLTLLTGVIIAAVVALTGFAGYFWYCVDMALLETANLSVVTTSDGIALIRATNLPRSATMQLMASEMTSPEAMTGLYEVTVRVYATRFDARHRGGGEIYFVIGSVAEDRICVESDGRQEAPVYSMLYGRTDGSGKVFYLSGEDEIANVSLKGAHLKSPETVSITGHYSLVEAYPFITSTPMPFHTPGGDGSQAYIMARPSPTPTVILPDRTWAPLESTSTPMPMRTGERPEKTITPTQTPVLTP